MTMLARFLLVVFAAVVMITQLNRVAFAQSGESVLRSSDINDDVKLEESAANFQRDALNKLEERARELAGGDEAKFTMLLREGLKRLPVQVEAKERSSGQGDAGAVIANLQDLAREPSAIDKDPAMQAAVKRAVDQARDFGTRIVGGSPVRIPTDRLAAVALFDSPKPYGCSGVVVAPGAILTAAHCVCDFNLAGVPSRIVFGNDISDPLKVTHTIPGETRIFPSRSSSSVYCADFKKFGNGTYGKVCHRDVALVRFKAEMAPANLKITKLASKAEVDAAFMRETKPWIEVIGFGVSEFISENGILGFRNAGQKRYGRFDFYKDCPSGQQLDCANPGGDYCFGNREMIIRDVKHAETDSCGGDSGGPAYLSISTTPTTTEWRLVGLVSRALAGEVCGPGGIYSSIYHADVVDWLKDNNVPGL